MDSTNPYASPRAVAASAALSDAGLAAWRSGSILVVGPNVQLPDRCVKCNAPADGQLRRFRMSWHSPAAYLGLLLGLIPYILIAIILQKKLTVYAGVCDYHTRKRRMIIVGSILGCLAGLAVVIFAFAGFRQPNGPLFLGGMVLLLAAMVYGAVASRILWPKRIRKDLAWVKGACPDYLAAFPEYTL